MGLDLQPQLLVSLIEPYGVVIAVVLMSCLDKSRHLALAAQWMNGHHITFYRRLSLKRKDW